MNSSDADRSPASTNRNPPRPDEELALHFSPTPPVIITLPPSPRGTFIAPPSGELREEQEEMVVEEREMEEMRKEEKEKREGEELVRGSIVIEEKLESFMRRVRRESEEEGLEVNRR